jgi:hypothetical protein
LARQPATNALQLIGTPSVRCLALKETPVSAVQCEQYVPLTPDQHQPAGLLRQMPSTSGSGFENQSENHEPRWRSLRLSSVFESFFTESGLHNRTRNSKPFEHIAQGISGPRFV